jgi:hypothetical protein
VKESAKGEYMAVKQLIYQYDADPNTEEPLVDFDDSIPVPKEGERIDRNGRTWRVEKVVKSEVIRPKRFDLYRIYLIEA